MPQPSRPAPGTPPARRRARTRDRVGLLLDLTAAATAIAVGLVLLTLGTDEGATPAPKVPTLVDPGASGSSPADLSPSGP